jgi:hypothetical protein
MSRVRVTPERVLIEQVECADPGVVSLLADTSEPARPELVCRALAVGAVGLRAMGAAGQVEVVEREFGKLSDRFDAALTAVETSLLERVRTTFDPGQAESVSARLAASVAEAHQAATTTIEQARGELTKLIADSFNPDLATSCVYRIAKLTADTRVELDRAFDPAYEGSHLAKLAALVDSYFGWNGSLADLVADHVNPVKEELLKALQGLRELIAGQAAAAGERDRSPASGLDFEDDVYGVLCRLAIAHGDTVERVGTQPGDSGRSKQGDFVVQLPSGSRFVVEAKKRSARLPLRGDKGLLAILQGSMVNRAASFAIAVAPDSAAFAKEVGAFNEYDGDKVVCQFGTDGELLEVAYRWARTVLLTGARADERADTAVAGEAVEEARRAARELARIEAKAKAIAQGADDIQSMLTFQLRRITTALDAAAGALSCRDDRAVS